jgi:hypothetical protein
MRRWFRRDAVNGSFERRRPERRPIRIGIGRPLSRPREPVQSDQIENGRGSDYYFFNSIQDLVI